MSWETSGFGKSVPLQWIRDQIELLWNSVTGGDPPDLTSKVTVPDPFTLGNFATFNESTGALEDSGVNAGSFSAPDYELEMPVPGSYPHTYNKDTIAVTGNACRTAFIVAALGHEADLSQNRSEIFLLLLDNSQAPVVVPQGAGIKGTDFSGNLTFSIESGYLRVSYTVTDGAENPTFLKMKILSI
jgi:hypothetical protein